MRIAAISDVHGNVHALEAVLAHVRRRGADVVVNLGDVLSGAVAPRETADLLATLDLPTVRGNHDRVLGTVEPAAMGPSDALAWEVLTPEERAASAALPVLLDLREDVLAFHATPDDDLPYLLHRVDPDGLREATVAEVEAGIGTHAGRSLLLCGHTHLPRVRRVTSGALVVNPGSVGWPAFRDSTPYPHRVEAGTPHARYAVVDDSSGRWEVDLHAVAYDWEAAARLAERNGRPEVAHGLRTGHVPA